MSAGPSTHLVLLDQCAMLPRIDYLQVSSILAQQKEVSQPASPSPTSEDLTPSFPPRRSSSPRFACFRNRTSCIPGFSSLPRRRRIPRLIRRSCRDLRSRDGRQNSTRCESCSSSSSYATAQPFARSQYPTTKARSSIRCDEEAVDAARRSSEFVGLRQPGQCPGGEPVGLHCLIMDASNSCCVMCRSPTTTT